MSDLERRKVILPSGDERLCVLGPHGAVDFHGHKWTPPTNMPELIGMGMSGLEFHHRTPPDYMKVDTPSFEKCWLLDAPCWCDGTSLYANEQLLPLYRALDEDGFWRVLEHEYREHFEQEAP